MMNKISSRRVLIYLISFLIGYLIYHLIFKINAFSIGGGEFEIGSFAIIRKTDTKKGVKSGEMLKVIGWSNSKQGYRVERLNGDKLPYIFLEGELEEKFSGQWSKDDIVTLNPDGAREISGLKKGQKATVKTKTRNLTEPSPHSLEVDWDTRIPWISYTVVRWVTNRDGKRVQEVLGGFIGEDFIRANDDAPDKATDPVFPTWEVGASSAGVPAPTPAPTVECVPRAKIWKIIDVSGRSPTGTGALGSAEFWRIVADSELTVTPWRNPHGSGGAREVNDSVYELDKHNMAGDLVKGKYVGKVSRVFSDGAIWINPGNLEPEFKDAILYPQWHSLRGVPANGAQVEGPQEDQRNSFPDQSSTESYIKKMLEWQESIRATRWPARDVPAKSWEAHARTGAATK